MKKRTLSLLLALLLGLGLAVPASAVEDVPATDFDDVPANAYYVQAIQWATANMVTSGTAHRQFSPNSPCTRGQIITFLYRAADRPEVSSTVQVSDVSQKDYFYNAVRWAKEKGMFEGDTFRPNDPCTRLMAMEFMWKRIGSPVSGSNPFSDVSSEAVNWAVHMGITDGTSDTTFSPDQVCTRAQIVAFLYRAYSRGYDYERILARTMLFPFSICGTYTMDLTDGWYAKFVVEEAGGADAKVTFLCGSPEQGEDTFFTYTGFYPYAMKGFKLRYYDDFLIMVITDENSTYKFAEGIYAKEGHTVPDSVRETFAPLFSK